MRAKSHHAHAPTHATSGTNGSKPQNRPGPPIALQRSDALDALDAPLPPDALDLPYPLGPESPSRPTSASGASGPSFPPYELALDAPAEPRLATVQVSREDKAVFDALQAWWLFRRGRRLTQWELFSLLLGDALGNDAGELSGARRAL